VLYYGLLIDAMSYRQSFQKINLYGNPAKFIDIVWKIIW